MRISEIDVDNLTKSMIDRTLYKGMAYHDEPMDIAIVLGSDKAVKYRLPVAVELLDNNRTKYVVMSGGNTYGKAGVKSEAEILFDEAVKMGVDPSKLILEKRAMTTLENMQYSKVELENRNIIDKNSTIGLVTTMFHMRRSIMMAHKVFGEDVKFISVPA